MTDSTVVRSGRRRIAATVSALVVLALAGGAGWTVAAGPFSTRAADAVPALDVSAAPGPVRLACGLPVELATGGGGSADPEFAETTAATLADRTLLAWARSGTDSTAELVDTTSGTLLATKESAAVRRTSQLTAIAATADPVDGRSPAIAGVTAERTGSGDLRGLAAWSCLMPESDQWIVGGATTVGSSARLVLENPGSTTVSVSVTEWGPAGEIALSGAGSIVVPAGETRSVLLEGLGDEAKRTAIRVRSNDGKVVATVQDTQLRGLVPAGVDVITPTTAPAQHQLITGVAVEATEPNAMDPAAVRVLVPGEADAQVSLYLVGPEGQVELQGLSPRTFSAGTVTDVSLAGLPEGTYSVVIDSDVPVAAVASVVRGSANRTGDQLGTDAAMTTTTPIDRAWAVAQTPRAEAGFALPSIASAALVIARDRQTGDGDQPGDRLDGSARTVEVVPVTTDGRRLTPTTVTLTDDTVTVPLDRWIDGTVDRSDIAGLILDGDGGTFVAAVVLTTSLDDGGQGVSIIPAAQDAAAATSVRVLR